MSDSRYNTRIILAMCSQSDMCKGPVQATGKISAQLNTKIPILQGLLVYEYTKRKHNNDVGITSIKLIAIFFVQNVEVYRHIFLVRLTMD